jgi:hypothetical protein
LRQRRQRAGYVYGAEDQLRRHVTDERVQHPTIEDSPALKISRL